MGACLHHEEVGRGPLAARTAIGPDMAYLLAMPGDGPKHGATAAILTKKSEGLLREPRTTIRAPVRLGGPSMSVPPMFNEDDREYLGELFNTHGSLLDNMLKR